jgi:uncharacterized protein (TIGR03083 family)
MSRAEREMLRAERADIREFVATLTAEEWAAPSLCAGWTVRDVVVHLIGPPDASVLLRHAPGMVTNFGRQMDRANAARVAEFDGLSQEQVLAAYDASTRAEHPAVQVLADKVIHHQDIRRPLGSPRVIPRDRLEASLRRVIASRWVFGGSGRAKGLRVEALDVDFTHGDGPLVSGAGEALLLALAGRPAALDDLDGEGLATLRTRVSSA